MRFLFEMGQETLWGPRDYTGAEVIDRGAEFSPCGLYRYSLWRTWDPEAMSLAFIMLNPSTADVETNDPTVERCEQRARRRGYGGLIVANIMAYRATDPSELYALDPEVRGGPDTLPNADALAKVLIGDSRVIVPKSTKGSIFPSYVKTWKPGMRETIFKDGAHNRKIGGDVLVGDIRGAYLVTLALEERATCPTTCAAWRICYGNNMNQARRWKYSRALLKGMRAELARLCAKYPGVLVRLHVLGDFPEPEYIEFWDEMLGTHRNLFCFGFTAHRRGTRGGEMIADLRSKYPGPFAVKSRFAVRHSDSPGDWGSEIIPTVPEIQSNSATVCPEQMDAIDRNAKLTHCGSCAACWQSACNIQFLEH